MNPIQISRRTIDDLHPMTPESALGIARLGYVAIVTLQSTRACALTYERPDGELSHVSGSRSLVQRYNTGRIKT